MHSSKLNVLAKGNLHRIYIFLTLRLSQLLLSTYWTVAVVTVLVVGSHGADGYAYHNDNAGLTEVPDDIPSTVLTVYLSWNEISDVKPGAFSCLQWCRYIHRTANIINIFPQRQHFRKLPFYYRLQEKVMFSEACVCHSVHGGELCVTAILSGCLFPCYL